MKKSYDTIAHCLTADDHPHLKEDMDFQKAQAEVDASPELQQQLEVARAFFEKHPRLMDVSEMPSDVRNRIAKVLAAHQPEASFATEPTLSPWEVRRSFAWAACLVLLLAGMAVLSSRFMEHQAKQSYQLVLSEMPPQDAFRAEVGRLLKQGMPLQVQAQDATQLVSWLGDRGMPYVQPPQPLMDKPTMGCARFQTPFGDIGVICFKVENGVLHMFVADAGKMGLESVIAPRSFELRGRRVKEWSDEETLYLLVPQEPETDLPELFL